MPEVACAQGAWWADRASVRACMRACVDVATGIIRARWRRCDAREIEGGGTCGTVILPAQERKPRKGEKPCGLASAGDMCRRVRISR